MGERIQELDDVARDIVREVITQILECDEDYEDDTPLGDLGAEGGMDSQEASFVDIYVRKGALYPLKIVLKQSPAKIGILSPDQTVAEFREAIYDLLYINRDQKFLHPEVIRP